MVARVCICDDDPIVSELMSLELRAAGFGVDAPIRGVRDAMTLLGSNPPDVLVLDINMPNGGGLELLSFLSVRGLLDETRVLMLTGEDDTYFMDRARSLGASGYLVKPVKPADLCAKVRRLLGDPSVRWIDDVSTVTQGAARPAISTQPEGPPRKHILSVEDVSANQQLIALFLESETCVVDKAESGVKALSALQCKRYDLILLDLRLPDMDGLELISRIRSIEQRGAHVPIVAVSADVMDKDIARAKAAGVDAFVPKPFTSSMLLSALSPWLDVGPGTSLERSNPTIAELTSAYGKTTVERLLSALIGQIDQLAATVGEPAQIEHIAHAIKGAAASLGFASLSHACTELEAACRKGERFDRPLKAAAAACDQARNEIARFVRLAA